MTTPTPRWTADTEELMVGFSQHAINDERRARCLTCRAWARQVLTALADAGVLKEVRDEDVA